MLRIIGYFCRCIQFVVAVSLAVLALNYGEKHYKEWCKVNEVPEVVAQTESDLLNISAMLRSWVSKAAGKVFQPNEDATESEYDAALPEIPQKTVTKPAEVVARTDTGTEVGKTYADQIQYLDALQKRLMDSGE